MTPPDLPTLYRAMETTWCPASARRVGPWTIRDGAGGGQRVSAATAEAMWTEADLDLAEREMRDLEQTPLFMVRDGDDALDAALEKRGYAIVDPVVLYLVPVAQLAAEPLPLVTTFRIWTPLAIMADIWAAGGVGAARLEVMKRVAVPKTAIMGRQTDRPAGAAFVALAEDIAMIHAIEVVPALRKQGVGGNIMRAAAHWGQEQGAKWLALAVTRANAGANALYVSLGMQGVGHYHYRKKTP